MARPPQARPLCRIAPWILGLLALAAACGGRVTSTSPPLAPAHPESLAKVPLYFVPGEAMLWEVRYMGVLVGRARLAVGQPGTEDGRSVIAVSAEAQTDGIVEMARAARDVMESHLDVALGVPARSFSELKLRGKHVRIDARRQGTRPVADIFIERVGGRHQRRERRLPEGRVHDALSSFLTLRGWTPAVGSSTTLVTLGGERLWRSTLLHVALETLDTPFGTRTARRIEGHAMRLARDLSPDPKRTRSFTMWLSDDPERLLLRLVADTEYGQVEMRATGYFPPG